MGLPSPELERHVRMVSVAPHLRVAVGRLPQPVRIDATLPDDVAAIPLGARQVLKLALEGVRLRFGEVTTAPPPCAVAMTLAVGEKRLALDASDLAGGMRALLTRMLGALFDPSDVTHLLESLAFQSSSLTTLRQITARMLASTDLDEALYLMLAGLTSGYGLSFDRAALFMWDAAKRGFVGTKAIGPYDDAEAHRIWEAIELEGMTIERLIDDYADRRFDTRFQQRVQTMMLVAGTGDDEVGLALREGGEDLFFDRPTPMNPELVRLDASGEMVLGAVRTRGELLGLIFADNCYSKERITRDQLEHVRLYVDQIALVWENLSLLARVAEHARTDPLTGILNRRELEIRFEQERSRSARSGASLSLVLIDVDFFKSTNDTRGHEAGDDVLRRLGQLLGASVRTHDVLARYGGDEFVALLPDVNVDQLAAAARRIGGAARAVDISLSIGGATWPESCATRRPVRGRGPATLPREEGRPRLRVRARSTHRLRRRGVTTPSPRASARCRVVQRSGKVQSIGFRPFDSRKAFALEKWRQPKNPL
ncbi:MAG: GGDEF domain-containing protein [Labilithrix sp.]|nr:GGDEF domain-containing protein [Labilithrix sp.]MCW5813333.1 GGDEF domain-containing protein [Labilithrix sp.]